MGIPVLREFAEFSIDAHWLNGLTVLTNHEELTPDARRVGQLADPLARPESLDVSAVTQFFEIDLTQREKEAILSKAPINGSLYLAFNLEWTPGEWTNLTTGEKVHFEARERGPYVFYEYSMVRQGVVTPADGAGFNMECNGCKHHNPKMVGFNAIKSLSPAQLAVNGGSKMEGKGPAKEPGEIKEGLGALDFEQRLQAIEKENATTKAELKALKEADKAKAEGKEKALFMAKLKPGFLEKGEELWARAKEIGYLAFEA
jgi:hypothetical protein